MQILMVDGAVPDRDAAASDRAIIDQIDGLLELGHEVTFCALVSDAGSVERARSIASRGAVVADGLGGRLAHLREVAVSRHWDVVVAQRPATALTVTVVVDLCPSAATILWGHDISGWRLRDQQALLGDVDRHFMRILDVSESRSWDAYDLSVYPTTREAHAVSARPTSVGRGAAMPYYRLAADDLVDVVAPYGNRHGCLMVGTASHAPNRDAVNYAVHQVLPILQSRDPAATLTVVGDWPVSWQDQLARPGVTFLGRVSDAELRVLHRTHLCLLAPLRFGAGSRRKLVAAMGLGLPVVTTSEGIRGLLVRDAVAGDGVLLADQPEALAEAVVTLGSSPQLWHTTAMTARDSIAAVYAAEAYDRALAGVLDRAVAVHAERREPGHE